MLALAPMNEQEAEVIFNHRKLEITQDGDNLILSVLDWRLARKINAHLNDYPSKSIKEGDEALFRGKHEFIREMLTQVWPKLKLVRETASSARSF